MMPSYVNTTKRIIVLLFNLFMIESMIGSHKFQTSIDFGHVKRRSKVVERPFLVSANECSLCFYPLTLHYPCVDLKFLPFAVIASIMLCPFMIFNRRGAAFDCSLLSVLKCQFLA